MLLWRPLGAGRSPTDVVIGLAGQDPLAAVALVLTVGVLAGLFAVAFSALPEVIRVLGGETGGSGGVWTGIDAPRRLEAGSGKRP